MLDDFHIHVINIQFYFIFQNLTDYSVTQRLTTNSLSVEFAVIIGEDGGIAAGYHVENIVVTVKYNKQNIQHMAMQPLKLNVINSSKTM